MIITKGIGWNKMIRWTAPQFVLLFIAFALVAVLYDQEILTFSIPWVPISVIGTAVAFYVGFKNNSAYDRMWEARKIWGGIVNYSRTWGTFVDGFITDKFADKDYSKEELQEIKKQLIYRHVAWLYALRSQLLVFTSWEHAFQGGMTGKVAKHYQQTYGVGLVADEVTQAELKNFLPMDEHDRLVANVNTATQIINEQSRTLTGLRDKDLIDDFRHMELEKILAEFYNLQGKCERIKKFPLPRQYSNMSRIFVGIFLTLLPFSTIPPMVALGEVGFWLSIPITTLVGWVYLMMESVGEYTENPFQGMANDIPMLSLCRTIEIDLREMLGETELPAPIKPKNGVLM